MFFSELTAPAGARDMQGVNAERYGAGHDALSDDEALMIEFEPPDATYWNFELGDLFQRSLDLANRPISINDHQAVVDPDGLVRITVSSRDAGLANWLDTTGVREGPMTDLTRAARRENRGTAPCSAAAVPARLIVQTRHSTASGGSLSQ